MTYRTVAVILILVAIMILTLPAQGEQKVAPTFRSACADLKVSATTPAPAGHVPP